MILHNLYTFLFGTLRGRLILGVAAVHAVMMTLFIGDLTVRQRAMLLDRQIEEATALSHALATSSAGWIAADDISGLQELVEAQRRYPEMLFAVLADKEGRVLADTDKSRQGQCLLDLPRDVQQTVLSKTPALVDVAVPAMIGGRHVGWVRVGIGQRAAGEKLSAIIRNGVIYALAAILIGSVVAWLMGLQITRRLYAVQNTIDEVRSGNRRARSSVVGTDEAAGMAREFNSMLDTLVAREAELRSNERKYRDIFEESFDGLFITSLEGKILDINRRGLAIFGYETKEEMKEISLARDIYVDPVDRQRMLGLVNAAGSAEYEVEVKKKDGKKIFTHCALTVVKDQANQPVSYRGIIRDITDRKRAEKSLHRLNRELRAISNCNQILVRADDEQALLSDICRIVCDEAGYRMAWVGYAENDEARTIRPVARAGVEDGYLDQAGFTWADTERGRGPIGIAIRSGESACIQNFANDPQAVPWRDGALQRGYRSSISLPLKDESRRTFGVLNIYSAEINAFTPDEIRLLEELAGDLAFGIIALRTRIERVRAEEEIKKAGEYNRSLIEASLDPLVTIGPDGKITDVNATTEAVTGYSRDKLIGTDFSDYFTEPEKAQAGYRRVFQDGLVRDYPLEICSRDKKVTSVLYNASVYRNEEGQVLGVFASARDITERKEREKMLHLLGSIVESSNDAIIGKNLDGMITSWNKGAEEIYGYAKSEMIGIPISILIPDERKDEEPLFLEKMRRGEPVEHFETVRRRKDGKLINVSLTISPIKDAEQKVFGASTIARDITERKRAETDVRKLNEELEQRVKERTEELEQANARLKQLDQLKSMFIASMSHELRTPLNSIIGFSSILLNEWVGPVNAEQKENLAAVLRSGKHLLSLINDVIDVTKIEAGKIASISDDTDLYDVVMEALSHVENDIKNKGLDLSVQVEHCPLHIDRRRLLQCVLNLMTNAVKFTDRGSISVYAALSNDQTHAEISVSDTGIGICEEDTNKLFIPFVRLNSPIRAKVLGTGLGLYLTRKLLTEVLRGNISVFSVHGKGSRFTIHVPVKE